MRPLATALLFAFTCVAAQADPIVLGTWRSDRDLTMRFAREHASLENKTLLFLEQMMGRLTLTFAAARLTSQLPNWESETSEGVKSQLVGFKETHPYRVVATTRTQVAVVTPEPVTGRQAITVYNFDNADTMWIYLGGASFPEMTVREYFVRIK